MEPTEFLRVVGLRRGKVQPSEFQLRPGEIGLSLFAYVQTPSVAEILEAVREAGKRGDLQAAVLSGKVLHDLGLTLVRTQGGTPNAAINAIHHEIRLPWYTRVWLRLTGVAQHDYFNEKLSTVICKSARLLS